MTKTSLLWTTSCVILFYKMRGKIFLEQKVTSLQSELNSTQSGLTDCQKEYDSYKVDVATFVGVVIPATAGEGTKCSLTTTKKV